MSTTLPWLTVSQAAKRIQVSEATVRRLIAAGHLQSTRVGLGQRALRIHERWIDQALEAAATPGPEGR